MKKLLISALVLGALTACSGDSNENARRLISGYQTPSLPDPRNNLRQVLALRDGGAPAMAVTLEDRSISSVLQLSAKNNEHLSWQSSDNTLIVTHEGIVVATRGLGGDLMGLGSSEIAASVLKGAPATVTRQHRYLNGEDQITSVTFECDIRTRGPRKITYDGMTFRTRLVQERCTDGIQQFQNLYWVEVGGRGILQSRQWIGPEIGSIVTRRFF